MRTAKPWLASASLALVVVVVGCGRPDLGNGAGAPAAVRVTSGAPSALHATTGPGAALVDARGRQVLLRGVNVNALGDYAAADPALATVAPLAPDDFAHIATLGFDAVRLVVSWSLLEPRRGAVDVAYIARIRQAVGWAAARHLYVVIDLHQDAWGKATASPPGVVCPPGLAPALGWDGAPAWATLTDGQSTCRGALRELSPAVAAAWENFYADTAGIQTELLGVWRALAAAFSADPAVAGYDLMNEPHPGAALDGKNLGHLGAYYSRALAAIRQGESQAPGGFAHLVFFEPMVTWTVVGPPAAPPRFSADPDLVFAPHLYAGSLVDSAVLAALAPYAGSVPVAPTVPSIADGFAAATRQAAAYGTPWWAGEWGWFGDPAADAPMVADYGRREDAAVAGGAWWDWKQACGDPHQLVSPGGGPRAVTDGLVRSACPADRGLGSPGQFIRVLSRAYPRASAGRVTVVTPGPTPGTVDVEGISNAASDVEVWSPGTRRPMVTGARRFETRRVEGGWEVIAAVGRGAYRLHVAA